MIYWLAIKKMASTVPLWVYLCIGMFLLGFYSGYRKMSLKMETFKQEQAKVVQEWKTKAEAITTKTVIQYVDRIQVVHEQGEKIIKKVPVYVPRNVCSASWL